MNKKSSKLGGKQGRGNGAQSVAVAASGRKSQVRKSALAITMAANSADTGIGPTTRKTIEVPEGYFRRVKIRAVERGILEKELWAEIVVEYFEHHPTV